MAALLIWLIAVPVRSQTGVVTSPSATLVAQGLGPVSSQGATFNDQWLLIVTQEPSGSRVRIYETPASGAETLRWQWPAAGSAPASRIMAPPSISSDGSVAYVTTDAGQVHAIHTAAVPPGGNRVMWTFQVTPVGPKVRCQVAHHAANPAGPTVYFQADDGYLYAINASNGQQRWRRYVGGFLPTPTPTKSNPLFGQVANHHPDTIASPPVIDPAGRVIVATSGGEVWCLNAANGNEISVTGLRQYFQQQCVIEIEAPIAIGPNGRIYCASRRFYHPADSQWKQIAFAVDPDQPTLNTRVKWVTNIPSDDADEDAPGVLVGVTADRLGDVYVAEYGHRLLRLDGTTGNILINWSTAYLPGKLCATPALTESGLALVAGSDPRPGNRAQMNGSVASLLALRLCDPNRSPVLWNWTLPSEDLQQPLNFLGSPTVMADGRIYLGDTQGRLWRIPGGQRLMVGGWPTLQQDNRRLGVGKTVTWIVEELPSFYLGDPSLNLVQTVDPGGRVLGRSHGYPNYPSGGGLSYPIQADAVWNWGSLSMASSSANSAALSMIAQGNSSGVVVGWTEMYGVYPRIWQNGIPENPTALPLATGFSSAYATGINEPGDVVGYGTQTIGGVPRSRGIQWSKNGGTWTPSDIQFDSSLGYDALVYGVTIGRRIYGKARFSSTSPYHGFVSDQTQQGQPFRIADWADIGSPTGTSEVRCATEEGGFAGWTDHLGYRRAFRASLPNNGTAPPPVTASNLIPPLSPTRPTSEAYGVNGCGLTVGRAQNDAAQWRAFLHRKGAPAPEDLNAWVPAGSGWVLTSAVSISDACVITGYGTRNGQPRTWVLRPQP